jgi:hypothetical protein
MAMVAISTRLPEIAEALYISPKTARSGAPSRPRYSTISYSV